MRIPSPLPQDEAPLVGWREIAEYLGVKLAQVHRYRKRKPYPLPHYFTLGRVWASPAELQVWLRQGTIPGQAGELERADDTE